MLGPRSEEGSPSRVQPLLENPGIVGIPERVGAGPICA